MSDLFLGTAATKDFYERTGWHRKDGKLVDSALFTPVKTGPILHSMILRRENLIRELISGSVVNGMGVRLVECGCGGTPALFLSDRCSEFTAVDFSATGLVEAATALDSTGVPYRTVEADITQLPFADGEFDSAYSAHALYHIANPDGQAAALAEMMRIVRPGGRVVLVLANPYPLLFPGRFLRRTLAVMPAIGKLLNSIRTKPPLPYRPMRLGWYKKQLSKFGDVRIYGNAMSSTWFDRKASERNGFARVAWRTLRAIERRPRMSSRLGCYVTICAEKTR